jgi:membrane protein YdbS with pleckstrin-like domain
MYCIKCGADNSETATFCRKCGVRIEEEETRVATRKGDNIIVGGVQETVPAYVPPRSGTDGAEAQIFSISPTMIFIKAGYVMAAIGALLLVALVSAVFVSVPIWVAILVGLMLFLIPAYYHVKQKMVRYTLTDSKLEIDQGLISRTTKSVPIRRIQDVTVSAGVTQRMLGFGDLVIDNAGEEGGKVTLKNINTPKQYADILLKQMRQLDKASDI